MGFFGSYRSDALDAALAEGRAHPEGRPNLYWRELLRPDDLPFQGDWCGAFVLRSLQKAGLARGVPWIIGQGFIGPLGLPVTHHPLPGDIIYIGEPFQHQALVLSYDPKTGQVLSIDGNQPGIEPKLRFAGSNVTFYSIQPLIDAAEAGFSWGFALAGAALFGAGAWIWLNGVPKPLERRLARLGV